MELRYLSPLDMHEALKAHEELARDDFEFLHGYEPGMDWEQFLGRTENIRRGVGLPATHVPASFLVAEVAGEIVGRVSIRHRLNPFLRAVGGHIGYGVRPGFRRNGYATQILDLALMEAKELGIRSALLTCDADNPASRAVIENRGGVPEASQGAEQRGKLRYWIST